MARSPFHAGFFVPLPHASRGAGGQTLRCLLVDFEGFFEPAVDAAVGCACLLDFRSIDEGEHLGKGVHKRGWGHLRDLLKALSGDVCNLMCDVVAQIPDVA